MYDDYYDDVEYFERAQRFADPFGESALHPGERTEPCPTCQEPNRLTVKDVQAGYQCDACATRAERGGW
jgi:hypothetical protein